MANGRIRFGKQSGGELALVIPDGVSNTEVVLPESGVLATEQYADGKTTLAQVQAEISTGSNLVTSPTGAIGYGNGAGGVVTQLTSKTTAVVLSKPTGDIIMSNSPLAAGASASFGLLNSLISQTDTVTVSLVNGAANGDAYRTELRQITASQIVIRVTNISGGSLSESLTIHFNIHKGAKV